MLSRTAKKAHHRASQRINRAICLLALGPVLVMVVALGAQEAPNAQSSPLPGAPASAPGEQVSPSQPPALNSPPIAIVPIDASVSGAALSVTGPLKAWNGRAFITSSGEITAGPKIAQVALPYRGTLSVCPSTTVKLSVDSSVPVSKVPGLLIAFEAGALEANFAIARNSDVVLTPNFRIFIGGPGSADVKVRLGEGGDTCVDNAGANAPYVVVTSVFERRALPCAAGPAGDVRAWQPAIGCGRGEGAMRLSASREGGAERVSAVTERGPYFGAEAGFGPCESRQRAAGTGRAAGLQRR